MNFILIAPHDYLKLKFKKFIVMKYGLLSALFLFTINFCIAQKNADSVLLKNENFLSKLEGLIETNGSFKKAVFLSEQGFENKVSAFNYYYDFIQAYSNIVEKHSVSLKTKNYRQSDSSTYLLNLALFNVFCKYIPIKSDSFKIATAPFYYNFKDSQGDKDFTNTFVTTLLATHQGNCRSLTYLYKILADEIGAKCWLSLAPNHIYIRNYSKQVGWYNTELTSGAFPTDAWIAASGYITPDAIRSGLYMDTLSNQQAIGLCILDLVHGYIRQTNNYTDGFVLKGCNLVLKYHAVNPMALLLKAEVLKQCYLEQKKNSNELASHTFNEMEAVYAKLIKLGYREMPHKVYQQWLASLSKEKEKFENQQLLKIQEPLKTDSIKPNKPIKTF